MVGIASIGKCITRSIGRAYRDRGGSVAVYVTILLPFLIGGALLTVDAGRLHSLQTFLQAGADALALAGAAELDGHPDAITRADNAIANLVTNKMRLGDAGTSNITVSTKHYLSSIPGSDASAITSVNYTIDPAQARYVQVTVTPANFTTIFPATFLGVSSNATTTSATAVAGLNQAVCQMTPMFICNPYEGSNSSIFDAINDPAMRRRQIKLQAGNGGSSQYFPGNYGWLDSPTIGNGAGALRDALASAAPNACFVQNAVSQKTGNITNANDALNTRFDLWSGPYNNANTTADYRPALNVRKGYPPGNGSKGACNPGAQNPSYALGRDPSFPYDSGRMGDGNWDFDTYWNNNYPGVAKPSSWSNSNRPSRYDVYRYEISTVGSGNDLVAKQSAIKEVGTPQCYSGGGLNDDPDRRVLYAAILNCSEFSINGNSAGPYPVLAYGKFFITEPVPLSSAPDAGTIYSELIGLAGPGTDSNKIVRDIVQLVR
jgi:Flp pilus assembly protein TadG